MKAVIRDSAGIVGASDDGPSLHCGISIRPIDRSGSQADIAPCVDFVRFTPESGQTADILGMSALCQKRL
jgi:hypothetical protein